MNNTATSREEALPTVPAFLLEVQERHFKKIVVRIVFGWIASVAALLAAWGILWA